MAKARIGHFVEAQVLEALEVDYVDESEVLTPADEANHIDKWQFEVPFVCGATDLGEALRRIAEGAAKIRTKGEAGTGNIVEAVRHMRAIQGGIRRLQSTDEAELPSAAKDLRAPLELVRRVAAEGRLPVVNFSAGGIATPADAALMMQLGDDVVLVASKGGHPRNPAWYHNLKANPDTTVQVGSEIRKVHAHVASPEERERLWPKAVSINKGYATYQRKTSREMIWKTLGTAMIGVDVKELDEHSLLQHRGW